MVESPRFRTDLLSQRGEAEGITFYDVTDKQTGTSFRMYEVEYLVAKALDGRSLDAVAREVVAKLGVETNADELRGLVQKLGELGFLQGGELAHDVSAALESAVLSPPPAVIAPAAAPAPAPKPMTPSALAKAQQRPTKAPSDNQSPAIAAADALEKVSAMFKVISAEETTRKVDDPVAPMFGDPEPVPNTTPVLPMEALEEITDEPQPPALPPPPPPEVEFDRDTKTPVASEDQMATLKRASQPSGSMPAITVEADVPDGTTRSVMAQLDKLAPEVQPKKPEAGLHHEPTDKVQAVKMGRRGTSPWWLLVPLVLVAGLVVALVLPSWHSSPVTQVRVEPVHAETIVRLYPGSAQLHAAEPIKFSFNEGGTIAELLPPGQQVKSGDVLAKLDGYVKLEKQLGEVRSREAFYQNELDKAERANNEAGIKHAQAKVEEKRSMIAALQARYGRFVLSATSPGQVGENLVKVGDTIEAGQPVTTVTQVRLRADLVMSQAEAGSLKTGMIARLARDDGKLVDCRVDKVDEEGEQATVHVEVIDPAAGLAAGDRVHLVRSRLEKVFKLPAIAVQHTPGGQDQVYVVQDGKARLRVVTVLDRDPREVIVGPGLAADDRVVVGGMLALRDGAPVQSQ